MNSTYPEIYTSNRVCSILNSLPELPEKPSEPEKPTKPVDPGEYDSGGNRGCSCFMMIVSVVGFFYVISSDKDNKFGMSLLIIFLFLISLFFFKSTFWDEDSHSQDVQKYKRNLASYPDDMKRYEEALNDYRVKLSIYEDTVDALMSDNYLSSYRADQLRCFLSHRSQPELFKIELTDSIKVGASEGYFKEKLKDEGFNILEGYKVRAGFKYFYPDILIEYNGLYIDIEIDEPYSGNDGTPIHYLKDDSISLISIDRERNNCFTSQGFEVIRFSEEQVFCYTEYCIDTLKQYVQSLLEGKKYIVPDVDDFVKQKWYFTDSMKMAYRRFRKTYVPYEYASFIDREEQHSYQEILNEIEQQKRVRYNTEDLPF